MNLKNIFAVLSLGILCSCASSTVRLPSIAHRDGKEVRAEMAAEVRRFNLQNEKHINKVFYPLIKNTGADLCNRKLKNDIGIRFGYYRPYDGHFWSSDYLINKAVDDDLQKVSKVKESTFYVRFVIKGSPAEKAGIKENDRIISLFGVPLPVGYDTEEASEKLDEIIKNNQGELGAPVDIEISRQGKKMSFTIKSDVVCPYNIWVDSSMGEINAYADGDAVYVSNSAIAYFTNDNDLAAVLAHELAHNTMGHSVSKQANANLGLLVGGLVDIYAGTDSGAEQLSNLGVQAYSKDFEAEADYVSVYYLARAGYDYKKAKEVQRKLANLGMASLYIDGETHPTPQYRYLVLDETAKQVDVKKSLGMDLFPDFKYTNYYLKYKRD